jgi:gliding motility-associated-like protein
MNGIRQKIGLLFAVLLAAGSVQSQNVFLKGEYVEVGVHPSGSFGSSSNAPSSYHARGANGKLGFVCDIGKDGWNTGTPGYVGDYFVPGDPEEGWGIQWQEDSPSGRVRRFNNFGLNGLHQVRKISHNKRRISNGQQSEWLGGASDGTRSANVFQTVTLDTFNTYFTISVLIQNTGSDTLFGLKYFRNVDPDNEQPLTGNYTTKNYIDFQPGVGGNTDKAVVVAEGLRYGVPCILGTVDSRAHVSIGGFTNRNVDDLLNNNRSYTKDSPLRADRAISLSFVLGELAPGKCVKLNYYYALQPVNPEDVEFPLTAEFNISDDGFKSSQTFTGGNLCVKDTILQFAVLTEGAGSSFIDKVLWDLDNDGVYDTQGDTAEITFPGWKSHKFGQRIMFCDGSIQDSVYTFYIEPKPVIQFTAKTDNPCFNEHEFKLDNTSWYIKDSIQLFTWKFGNGQTQNMENPSPIRYDSFTQFKAITLIAETTIGCVDSSILEVELYASPTIELKVSKDEQCLKENLFKTNNTVTIPNGTVSSTVIWGDGNSTLDTSNAEHSYSAYGDFDVRLMAQSDKGCLKEDTVPIRVNPMPEAKIGVNDSVQCLEGNEFIWEDQSSVAEGTFESEWKHRNDTYTEGFSLSQDAAGEYTVNLQVTSDKGCLSTIAKTVEVLEMPEAIIVSDTKGQCLNGNAFNVNGQIDGKGQPYKQFWYVKEALVDQVENVEFTFEQDGLYPISFEVITEEGCKDLVFDTLEVYPQTDIKIETNLDKQCLRGNEFNFTNNSSIKEGRIDYRWVFGDGKTSNEESPAALVYAEAGQKDIQLFATTDKGCEDSLKWSLQVWSQPTALISIDAVDSCLRTNRFNIVDATESVDPHNLQWIIQSQGNSRIAVNPILQNQRFNGQAMVTLTVKTEKGCVDTSIREVKLYPHPEVEFSVTEPVCLNRMVDIQNQTNTNGISTDYQWRDNNEFASEEENVNGLVYPDPGSYTLTLRAENVYGCKDEKSKIIKVYPSTFVKLVTDKLVQCYKGNMFNLQAVNENPELGLRQLDWEWSNGDIQQGASIQKSFNDPGQYQVSLYTENEQGCKDTLQSAVTVLDSLLLTASADVVCFPMANHFESETIAKEDRIVKHVWEVDGQVKIGKDVKIRLRAPGIYNYRYWVETEKGCRDTAEVFSGVMVRPKPSAGFELDSFFSEGLAMYLNLQNTSSEDVTQWGYSMNDWEYSADPNPQFLFTDTGLLNMILIVGNDFGCFDTIQKAMGPYFPMFYMHVPNAFTVNNDGLNDKFQPIITEYLMKYSFKILNRWGEKIFETNDPKEGWDGTFKGQRVQDGAYVFILRATDLMGDTYSDKGEFLLLR